MRWARRCAAFTLADSPPAPYRVLATDYVNYDNRQPTLAEETVEELHSALSSVGVELLLLLGLTEVVKKG